MANANRDKGNRAELELARYLRAWFPNAERSVAAGFKSTSGDRVVRESQDRGDIRDGCLPGWPIVWQCKDVVKTHPKGLANSALRDLLVETRRQRDAASAQIGLLVEKRAGHANPAVWWVHLTLQEVAAIRYRRWFPAIVPDAGSNAAPVRLELGDLMAQLEASGFIPAPTLSPQYINTLEESSDAEPVTPAI